ncbi:hypothetical protein DFJ74DRAFT_111533 [Hyaloraphidium curvatum]|nr:hypothetical protein DFJ74DRAFT_111533 [Hyaloraphidium curvatum]
MLKSTAPVCPQLGKDGSLPTPSPRGGAARKRGGGQQPASQPEPASDEAPDQQQPPRGSGEYDAAATAAAGQLAYGDYALRQGFPPQPAFAGPGVSQDPMVNFYAQQAAQAQAAAAAAAAAASQQAAMQAAYRPDWSYGGYAGYGQAAQGYFGAYDAQLAAAGTGMVQGTMNGQNFTYYPPFGAGGIAPQAAADAGGYWSAGYAQQQGGFPGAGTSPGWPQQTSQPPTTPSQPPTTVPFSHPHLLPKIAKIVAESLDQTAPVLHYPTFVARAIVGRVSQVLVDTVVWAAAITSVRKGDTLAREIDAAMGGIGLQGLQERCRSSIMAAFDAFDRAGRPVVNATTRPARLALLQSAILACVTHSRAGNTEEAHDIHAVAVAVHASMRFGDPDCPSTAAYRARCDAMPLVDYLDAEEHCRACVVGANVDSAISALRDHRPTILLSQYPGVALPSTDTGFAMLPAAVEHSWTAAVSALPAFGIEQADGRRPIGQWLDRMQMEGLWPADRRYPLSCSESVLWMEKAPGPERERALGIAVGGLLDNGQTAAATLLVLVNDRVRMVRRWFGERKLAVHRPGEWDASLDPPQGPVPQALVQEAEGMRAATQEMLREFQEKVPIVLKGLDGEGDGKGLVEIGEEKWGKVAGHRLWVPFHGVGCQLA